MVKKTETLKAPKKTAKTKKIKEDPKEVVKIVEKETQKLLELMKAEAKIEIKEDKENEAIAIQLTIDEPGILIGYHGETLSALQLILSLLINKKLESWTRIIVNVNDYRQKREESLRMIALNSAQKVKFSGEPVVLTDLSPSERRIIHLALAEHPDVLTVSEGEGRERRLVIKSRSAG